MILSKISFRRNLWIYTVCAIIAILILFGLNWVLRLPAVIEVIGDENTWLPIVADAVISGIIFIAGNWYSNADRLRNIIDGKKRDFSQISNSVNRVVNSLNIARKQRSILYSIEISMETPTLINEILVIQQEIDEAQQEFNNIKYLIEDNSAVSDFEECITGITAAYHVAFDSIQAILNGWISTVSMESQAKTVADYIGKDSDKSTFAMKYVESCKKLQEEKDNLLRVYDKQKSNVDKMYAEIQSKAKHILDIEHSHIVELERKL